MKKGVNMLEDIDKPTINMLSDLDNYLSEHEGKMTPILAFLGISIAPFLLYAIAFQGIIPLKYVIIFEVLWTIRWALIIPGQENKKLEQFRNERKGIYKTADKLIRCELTDIGMIQYMNGTIAYVLSGYLLDYADDQAFSIDLQKFLKQLRGYEYDIHSHMVVDEERLQDNIEQLKVYQDKSMIKERMLFYQDQDEYCTENTVAYKVNIVVKASKYDWKVLYEKLDKLIHSDYALCWKELRLCNVEEANDFMSRDLCLNVNITSMLVEKYKTDEYYGSKVLFYGDKVPDKYKNKKEDVNLKKRRVTMK